MSAAVPQGSVRPPKPRFAVTVKRLERLTPRMVRVTFTGPELTDFAWNGPAAHIKLIFATEAAQAALPGTDSPRPATRTYTPRRFDRDARELDVDFVIHGEGPASAWASQVAVGQTLLIAGPGRNYAVDTGADWHLLAGDDTAIPAISTILEALPPDAAATVFLEVVDAAEEHELHVGANTSVTWLHRGPDPSHAGGPLEATLRGFQLPPGSGRIYVACESGAMRRIRRLLLNDWKLSREQVVTRGYWKLGAVDHPDRDYGEDTEA
jgi:NADPH-dependent ferric siderophore reductase